jgi:MSHA pilin protein MshD
MMKLPPRQSRERGLTLIELIVAIVVIGITLTSMLALLSSIALRSADTLVQTQSTAIASAYLDEIMAMSFNDPDGVGEANRNQYDDIGDYSILPDQIPRTRAGTAMAGLGQYRVAVAIQNASRGLGPNAVAGRQVTVTVTSPTGDRTVLSGFRANHTARVIY